MNVLVFNCGSSSLKYRLIAMPSEQELAGGEAQRVGPPTTQPSRIIHRQPGREQVHTVAMPDHAVAFDQVIRILTADPALVPDAVGHRMVHGGTRFDHHARVTPEVLSGLDVIGHLAPLHNPPATVLVRACRGGYPSLPQVLVFDTAYHATIPAHARTYALPRALREELGLRKYGFHGTSHQYVAQEAARVLGRPIAELNAVSCHLGTGGASVCAIVQGQSVDNTMGYSPLQGLVMSTRSGDLDPAVVLRLLALHDGDGEAVERMLNKHSGVLGLSGVSSDIRDVLAGADSTHGPGAPMDPTAQVYTWRLRKYLGAYLTVVGRADAVIFTDTIGETVAPVRWAACADMGAFGLAIDPQRNRHPGPLPADVATDHSHVRILVIQTNEELAIAQATHSILAGAT